MTGSGSVRTSPAPWDFAAPWEARGYVTQLDGPVHWIEFGPGPGSSPDSSPDYGPGPGPGSGPDSGPGSGQQGPPIVFVHGLAGSHLNWCLVGSQLAAGRRAVALDLHGFGLTPGTRATATVQANRRLLDRFVRQITGTPVVLVGNSMGGLISVLQTATAPDTVAGLVLIDPALPVPRRRPDRRVAGQFLLYALPGVGELYVRTVLSRRPPQQAVQQVIELCFADPSRADPAMVKALVALAAERQAAPAHDALARSQSFLAASRSLMGVLSRRQRYWAMMAGIAVPVLLIGGTDDRLIPAASMHQASARNPHWESVMLTGVGHTPQLEVPDLVIGTMRDWLDRQVTPTTGRTRLGRNGKCSN
jgi:pimeloyl-ACP methyl ester carboxylesterase